MPAPTGPLAERLRSEIEGLGLAPHVEELERDGYTVIPPQRAAPPGLAARLREAILDLAQRKSGVRPDLETGATHAGYRGPFFTRAAGPDSPFGELLQALLFEGPVFEAALMNPVVLAMATQLLGYGCVLSSMSSMLKGPGEAPFALHVDSPLDSPLPPYSAVCNCTYALTDYSRENGALALVPGSHRWCRVPEGDELRVSESGPTAVVPVECPAGSLICWHGNLWHGAFPRTAPGLRVNLILYFALPSIRTQEDLVDRVTPEMLARNGPRFAILSQQAVAYGFHSQEDFLQRIARAAEHVARFPEGASRL
jgi:ectoine hydroxylase-related dioxygenase (phytanoyl-CoA dioxygenase family)